MHVILPLFFAGFAINLRSLPSGFYDALAISFNKIKVPHSCHENFEQVIILNA
jgi:hypothetical protein